MQKLILIDLALCAVLILVAAPLIVRRWRRGRAQPPVPAGERHGAAAGPAGGGAPQARTAFVPGFSGGAAERDLGAEVPAEPDLGAEVPAEPDLGAEVPAEPEQVTGSQVGDVIHRERSQEPGPDRPGAEPDGPQAEAGDVTTSQRIGSYFDQADQPMSDYLAAMGWTEEPETRDPW